MSGISLSQHFATSPLGDAQKIAAKETYEKIQMYGYPLPPGIELLLRQQEHDLRLLACVIFDYWWSGL